MLSILFVVFLCVTVWAHEEGKDVSILKEMTMLVGVFLLVFAIALVTNYKCPSQLEECQETIIQLETARANFAGICTTYIKKKELTPEEEEAYMNQYFSTMDTIEKQLNEKRSQVAKLEDEIVVLNAAKFCIYFGR